MVDPPLCPLPDKTKEATSYHLLYPSDNTMQKIKDLFVFGHGQNKWLVVLDYLN